MAGTRPPCRLQMISTHLRRRAARRAAIIHTARPLRNDDPVTALSAGPVGRRPPQPKAAHACPSGIDLGRRTSIYLHEWLQRPRTILPKTGEIIVMKDAERLRVTGSVEYEPYTNIDDILIINGDSSCRASCLFQREIYVKGNCAIGPGSKAQAIAVDGNLELASPLHLQHPRPSIGLIQALPRPGQEPARSNTGRRNDTGLAAPSTAAISRTRRFR